MFAFDENDHSDKSLIIKFNVNSGNTNLKRGTEYCDFYKIAFLQN